MKEQFYIDDEKKYYYRHKLQESFLFELYVLGKTQFKRQLMVEKKIKLKPFNFF
jgi:hypothetical protein